MLKNVVLPAPLGPMIETIERSGSVNVTSLTAVRPPNCLVMLLASRIAGLASDGAAAVGSASRSCPCRVEGFVGGLGVLGELHLVPPLGQQALRAQDHHHHEQEAVDRERDLRRVEVEPELARARR